MTNDLELLSILKELGTWTINLSVAIINTLDSHRSTVKISIAAAISEKGGGGKLYYWQDFESWRNKLENIHSKPKSFLLNKKSVVMFQLNILDSLYIVRGMIISTKTSIKFAPPPERDLKPP